MPPEAVDGLLYPGNPNEHSADQLRRIAEVIEALGFRWPCILSRLSGKCVAGNGRMLAAKSRGWQFPVVWQNFESEDEEKAFVLADNRLGELSERNQQSVADLLKDLSSTGFDLTTAAYDPQDLTALLAELDPPDKPAKKQKKEKPEFILQIVAEDGTDLASLHSRLRDIFPERRLRMIQP